MALTELIIIMGLALLIWFWLDSMKINESAHAFGAQLCKKNNVQFLDDTVHLSSIKFAKNSHGKLLLYRKYKFEFTNSELHRYNGEIILAGRQFYSSHMDVYRFNESDSDHL